LSGGLLCLSGSVLSEPAANQEATARNGGGGDVWGDPEEREQANRSWTWFGMGYEQRTRASSSGPVAGHGPARTKAGGGSRGGPSK